MLKYVLNVYPLIELIIMRICKYMPDLVEFEKYVSVCGKMSCLLRLIK